MDILSILWPIEYIIAWIIYIFHQIFTFGQYMGPGIAWIIAIVFLTLTVRTAILPLYVKQMNATSKMQELQPQIQRIQKKYKNKTDRASKEAMNRETMELYSQNKANPMSSCLPLLIQAPVLLALYNTLRNLDGVRNGTVSAIGPINADIAGSIQDSTIFGVKLSEMFSTATAGTGAKIVIITFIVLMCLSMFFTQYTMITKNMPVTMKGTSQYKMQRNMMIIFPTMYIFMGLSIPLGVLVYWLTSNIYNLVQQEWRLRTHPTPDSEAFFRKKSRDEAKNVAKGLNPDGTVPGAPKERKTQRTQPKKGKSRKDRKKSGATADSDSAGLKNKTDSQSGKNTSGNGNNAKKSNKADVSKNKIDNDNSGNAPRVIKKKSKKVAKNLATVEDKTVKEGDIVIINGKKKRVKNVHKLFMDELAEKEAKEKEEKAGDEKSRDKTSDKSGSKAGVKSGSKAAEKKAGKASEKSVNDTSGGKTTDNADGKKAGKKSEK